MNKTVITTDQNKLIVKRKFDAPLSLVWKAWTEDELLDQWWAPKPWKSKTTHMDFNEGGYRMYAMVGPEGEVHWGRSDYQTINELKSFSGEDSFCDEEGNIVESLPIAHFSNEFSEKSGQTAVTIITMYESREYLEQVIEMGIKEGFTAACENLDEVLKKVNPK
ncbi:MAG: SRPBCC domain-containing protein [Balneolaceae bacterium]|nr:SRPBCC domain-containing protein [Balneolaceae bacterium]